MLRAVWREVERAVAFIFSLRFVEGERSPACGARVRGSAGQGSGCAVADMALRSLQGGQAGRRSGIIFIAMRP